MTNTHGGPRPGAGRKQSIFRPSNFILGYLDEMIKAGMCETRAQALDIAFLLLFQVRPITPADPERRQ